MFILEEEVLPKEKGWGSGAESFGGREIERRQKSFGTAYNYCMNKRVVG